MVKYMVIDTKELHLDVYKETIAPFLHSVGVMWADDTKLIYEGAYGSIKFNGNFHIINSNYIIVKNGLMQVGSMEREPTHAVMEGAIIPIKYKPKKVKQITLKW